MTGSAQKMDDISRARDNWRTAIVLASIALVFFVGVMLKYLVFR